MLNRIKIFETKNNEPIWEERDFWLLEDNKENFTTLERISSFSEISPLFNCKLVFLDNVIFDSKSEIRTRKKADYFWELV